MDVKKKLTELLDNFPVQMEWHSNEELADHLIANGVTIQQWIPVTERLPTTDGRFMVTIKGRSGKPHVEMRNFHARSQKWENQCGWLSEENILAWQQRPRPFGWNPRRR